jgi:hypothetical protein
MAMTLSIIRLNCDVQLDDTWYYGLNCGTQHTVIESHFFNYFNVFNHLQLLFIDLKSFTTFGHEYRYANCRKAKCFYSEYNYSVVTLIVIMVNVMVPILESY